MWLAFLPSSDKAFKGTVVNLALPSLHEGSLEITLVHCTVLFKIPPEAIIL